jgi:Leucine-rich repeat (LRR) protein
LKDYLWLNNNELKIIESKTFYGMKNLLSLKLINNKVEAIEKNSFISLASLNELDLSYNQIEYLQIGTEQIENFELSWQ